MFPKCLDKEINKEREQNYEFFPARSRANSCQLLSLFEWDSYRILMIWQCLVRFRLLLFIFWQIGNIIFHKRWILTKIGKNQRYAELEIHTWTAIYCSRTLTCRIAIVHELWIIFTESKPLIMRSCLFKYFSFSSQCYFLWRTKKKQQIFVSCRLSWGVVWHLIMWHFF